MNIFDNAAWIWSPGDPRPFNARRLFRKRFELREDAVSISLAISADSRYRLWWNGLWVGNGPGRSYPAHQQYEVHNLTLPAESGEVELLVRVSHYGTSTFQYIEGRGGLIAALDVECADGSVQSIVTDDSWLCRTDTAYESRTPRISCQMPFEEQYDARGGDGAAGWTDAVVIGPAGTAPWTDMEKRPVPFLARDAVPVERILRTREVKAPSLVASCNLKRILFSGNRDAERMDYRAVLEIPIELSQPRTVTFLRCFTLFLGRWSINGVEMDPPEDRDVHVDLNAGTNRLAIELVGEHHYDDFTLSLSAAGETPRLGSWSLVLLDTDPSRARDQAEEVLSSGRHPESAGVCPVPQEMFSAADVWNTAFGSRPVGAVETEQSPECLAVIPAGKDIEVLLDYGNMIVGYDSFEIDAPEGTIIDVVRHEAMLGDEPQWTWGNRNSFRYVAPGGRIRFTTEWRRGGRYASWFIREAADTVRILRADTLVATYPVEEHGEFRCSDEKLNRIWEVGRHTLRCCMEDTFTDCPTYEQTLWVGDARIEALVAYMVYGVSDITLRGIILTLQSLETLEYPGSQVPSGWSEIIPIWCMLWIRMIREYADHTGDISTLRKVYPGVRRTLEAFEVSCRNVYGLPDIDAWNLFDWAPTDTGHSMVTHNAIFLIDGCRNSARLAESLGLDEDARRWSALAETLKGKVNEHLWAKDGSGYVDAIHADGTVSESVSQPTNTLALLYGVADGEHREVIRTYLTHPPEGMVRFGSPFASFFLLEALADNERYEDILNLIRERWGYMLGQGATTFWETFPGWEKNVPTRSHCHAWSSAPTYFLSAYQLGVTPLEGGWKRTRIAPQPAGLAWAEGRVPTPLGSVEVRWQDESGKFSLSVCAPAGMQLEVLLPAEADGELRCEKITGTGEYRKFTMDKARNVLM